MLDQLRNAIIANRVDFFALGKFLQYRTCFVREIIPTRTELSMFVVRHLPAESDESRERARIIRGRGIKSNDFDDHDHDIETFNSPEAPKCLASLCTPKPIMFHYFSNLAIHVPSGIRVIVL